MSENAVIITLGDVYKDVRSVIGKLDHLVTLHTSHAATIADHETRIRDLEKLVWKASGIAAFLGTAGGIVANILFGK